MEVWGLRPGGRHLGLLPLLSFQATYIVCILCPVAVRFWPLLSAPVQSYFLVQSQQETLTLCGLSMTHPQPPMRAALCLYWLSE
jgi:hypothetical protein